MPPVEQHRSNYGRLLANEALVGLLLGLGINILFSGIQVAGQIVSQMSGLSLADVFNPGFDEDVSVFSQLFYFLTLAVFVAVGGHRIVTEALLDTFAAAPPGHAALGDNFVEVLVSIVTQSFALGIRAAAPLLGRAVAVEPRAGADQPHAAADQRDRRRLRPQFAAGAGRCCCLSIGAAAWTFQDPTIDVMQQSARRSRYRLRQSSVRESSFVTRHSTHPDPSDSQPLLHGRARR